MRSINLYQSIIFLMDRARVVALVKAASLQCNQIKNSGLRVNLSNLETPRPRTCSTLDSDPDWSSRNMSQVKARSLEKLGTCVPRTRSSA